MHQVQDLHLASDIVPLFDYTISDKAAAEVSRLVLQTPGTIAEVLQRQDILKAILSNWEVLQGFTYSRLYGSEAEAFLQAVVSGEVYLGSSKASVVLRLLASEAERQRLRSRVAQLILLLRRLQAQYFLRIESKAFPNSFQKHFLSIHAFLNKLNLTHYAYLLQENKFSVMALSDFILLLQRLSQDELLSFTKSFALFEAYWSVAKGIQRLQLCFPEFAEANTLDLEDFYHPALAEPVKNSLHLDAQQRVVLLTGPNMSGKSTLLRSVGLCVYLAHAGLGVPASLCRLPYFHTITIIINANDSLQSGYSHFMAELKGLKQVVQQAEAGYRCFAMFDEIFRGTNIDDALEITRTTVNGLCKYSQSFFFVSTHLLQLQHKLQASGICEYSIACDLHQGTPRFTYKLQSGWSAVKIGKILFAQEGLDKLLA